MERDLVEAYFVALVSALIWIFVAFLVAYPQKFLGGWWLIDDIGISMEFYGHDWKERAAIPFLILVDVGIDLVLERKKRQSIPVSAILAIVLALVVYVGLSVFVPIANPDMAHKNGDPTINSDGYRWLFWIAFLCLLIPRGLSFVRPIEAAKFGKNFDEPA